MMLMSSECSTLSKMQSKIDAIRLSYASSRATGGGGGGNHPDTTDVQFRLQLILISSFMH